MTRTSDIERDLETLSEEMLADLRPAERVALAVHARADGDEDRLQKLHDTAEFKAYKQPNKWFQQGEQTALLLAHRAALELERGAWMFQVARLEGLWKTQLAANNDVEEWESVEEPGPENEFHERRAHEAAATFYADYLAWGDVARELFGVPLQVFLEQVLEPPALRRIETAAARADGSILDDVDTPGDLDDADVGGWAADRTVTIDDHDVPPKEAAEIKADRITSAWSDGMTP